MWLRSGLGLMGVGFAVARFGLFLREMQATQSHAPAHATGCSLWSGVALGVIVNIAGLVRHVRVVRELSSGTWVPGRVSNHGIALAALGAGMAIYLVLMH